MITKKIFLITVIILILFGSQHNGLKSISVKNKFILLVYPSKVDMGEFTFEVIELIFKDGFICYITSGLRREININIRELNKILNLINRKISEIKTFTHNHFELSKFSSYDWKFLNNLRWMGFRGEFLLYYKGSLYKR